MATSSIFMPALLLLLMSAVTPGLCTEDEISLNNGASALVIALKQVSQAMACFGDTMQEGLRQQRQNSDVLKDLHMLPATVLRVEERINQNDRKFESLKEKIEDITKAGDLERILNEKTSENERNVEKVQDLGRKLDESRQYAEKLEQLVQQLNNSVGSKKKAESECAQQPQQKITDLVLEFNGSRDWSALKRGLDAVLDHSSEAYAELEKINEDSEEPIWYIGYRGYMQLAKLLLCSGLPVDTTDKDGITLLYGAARNGNYQLAKMLVSRGADVNVGSFYGDTPLTMAAPRGHLDVVKLLVQAGADTTATDRSGHNALYWATSNSQTAVQQYLEQFRT